MAFFFICLWSLGFLSNSPFVVLLYRLLKGKMQLFALVVGYQMLMLIVYMSRYFLFVILISIVRKIIVFCWSNLIVIVCGQCLMVWSVVFFGH